MRFEGCNFEGPIIIKAAALWKAWENISNNGEGRENFD